MKWVTAVIKGSEVSIAFDENSIHIYNAFPIKDDLKLRGYRWNPDDKSWHNKPGDVEKEITVLQNNLQPGSPPYLLNRGAELSKFPASCSVVELRNRIDYLIREGLKGQIWVRGVIASQIKNYPWYSYFDLKDEADNQDIYFNVEVKKSDLEMVTRKLKELGVAGSLEKDLPVFCLVEVHLAFRNAVDIRLRVIDILPEFTQAKIRNQREITLDKLEKEGILAKQKRLKLPLLISHAALITSEQGTSIRDIMAGLSASVKRLDIYFVDTRMEGVNAVESILQAIDYFENQSGLLLDTLLLARGGGSEQSLAVFNDYRLCRRICECRIPILTAIGHEKDISAAEICSFFTPAPATPSGLGKFLHEKFVDIQMQLSDSVRELINRFSNIHNSEIEKLKGYVKNIPAYMRSFIKRNEDRFFALVRRFAQSVFFMTRDRERQIKSQLLQITTLSTARRRREKKQIGKTILKIDFQKRLKVNNLLVQEVRQTTMNVLQQAKRLILDKEKNLQNLNDLVKASEPDKILKKGFTLILDRNNRIIKTLQEFNSSEGNRLKFHDGIVKIKKNEEEI